MTELPAPLTPPDCDLRDFGFMPLDVRRLLTSETWLTASGDEKAAAITLWLESWHQVPAASLPDNDRMLAILSQAGGKWKKVRTAALRGFVLCSDGRLYHRTVAEKAVESWERKQSQRERGRRGNLKRWGSRSEKPDIAEASPHYGAGIAEGSPRESQNDRKGQGQGQGQGSSSELTDVNSAAAPSANPPTAGVGAGAKPDDVSFGVGIRLLMEQGVSRPSAAAFIGKLRKDHGAVAALRAVTGALERSAAGTLPADLKSWLTAAARGHSAHATGPPREVERPYMGM